MARPKENFIYEVYKGEYFVAKGTVAELAEKLGIQEKSIYLLASPAYQKINKGNRKVAYKLDENGERIIGKEVEKTEVV